MNIRSTDSASVALPFSANIIGGANVGAADGRVLDVLCPSDGRAFARIARSGAEDVSRAVAAARKAFEGAWGRLTAIERGPERAQIFRIQALRTCDIRDRSGARGERLTFPDRGGQVFFQRQSAAFVGSKDNALQIDLRSAARVGKPTVKAPDSRQQLVCPVAPGGSR